MKQTKYYVYVLDKDGKPMMPTTRYGKVRRMLRSGQAVAVRTKPFTIRLTSEPETHITQRVASGEDPGRTNIGAAAAREDGECLYRAKIITRNKEIRELMGDRRTKRQASRRGERQARKRLAKQLGTTMKGLLRRKLPGFKTGRLTVKDIINTESRFNNRAREEGWLTPTARQLLNTHLEVFRLMEKILPITDYVAEINKFAFMAMGNPGVKRIDYQHGPLYSYGSMREAIEALQNGKCLLCGKPGIEHLHHCVPRHQGGSDTIANIAGVHEPCHDLIHTDPESRKKLDDARKGLHQKYGALSVLNQIIPFLFDELCRLNPGHVYAVRGWDTKDYRESMGLDKGHDVDAYCIACLPFDSMHGNIPRCGTYTAMQFRRHDRQLVYAQRERYYWLDNKKVAMNRHMRTEQVNGKTKKKKQKLPSLDIWFDKKCMELGSAEAEHLRSRLRSEKSRRHYSNPKRMLPGTPFLYCGKRYVMRGQQNNGDYVYAFDGPDGKTKLFPSSKCTFIPSGGLQYV